ncbi:MAG: HAMP domain-containing histidine kinase [Polyangiaceae bacterium]|nr:HAMP domain-containing histidine kinase [Polyangiaceae bacterium]
MARRRNLKSISVPIILGSVTVPLTLALLVGWSVLFGQKIAQSHDIAGDVWLLVLGSISFVVIMSVLVLLSIFLAREILEVRRQDSFIDSVTHELKSPLASLKLFLETLGRGDLDDVAREKLRRMMLNDVERLSSFIDDVLQASRLAHQNAPTHANDIDVAELARSCVEAMSARHRLPEGAIEVDVPPTMTFATDRAALEIVLKNLVDNAIKYSDRAPVVAVRAFYDKKGRPVLEVEDQGMGISRKHRKRVFDRFYRVNDENVRRRRGTGLGLFVVSSLVKGLGGAIEARSEGEGKGTTMRIVLPADIEPSGERKLVDAERSA